ncbi:MAG: DUF6531 domain-containing protein, partial [Betaproteobacteria bacterium]|nr:DUF6531 domain-containing protein [Betaproteobacteria bacterium]
MPQTSLGKSKIKVVKLQVAEFGKAAGRLPPLRRTGRQENENNSGHWLMRSFGNDVSKFVIWGNAVLAAMLFAGMLSSGTTKADTVQPIYGAPYYTQGWYVYDPTATVGEQALDDWALYQQIWGVSPYGGLQCGYSFVSFPDGPTTGKFGAIGWTGQCGGGNYIVGTLGCPTGYQFKGSSCVSTASPVPAKEQGDLTAGSCTGQMASGDPVDNATGNLYERQADYEGSGAFPLRLVRSYNSQFSVTAAANGQGLGSYVSPMGVDWTFSYGAAILPNSAAP